MHLLCMWSSTALTLITTRRLESLPFDWFRLTSLKQVSLHTNPLMSPPMALAEKVRFAVYGLWSMVCGLESKVLSLGSIA
jgi:hypothetical protein